MNFKMFRAISKLSARPISYAGLWTFLTENADRVVAPKFDSPEYESSLQQETGWTRLKSMFTLDEFGNISMEVNSVIQAVCCAGFVGIIIGGVNKSKTAFNLFMDKNHANAFQSNFDAKQKLQSRVSTAFGSGGFRLGWRLAWFTTLYYGISTTISVYRGKSSVWEYIAGGSITGIIYKLPLGPRASLVGGVAGGILGTVAGGITVLFLRTTGTSVEEIRYWQYKYKLSRETALNKDAKNNPQKSSEPLLLHHTMLSTTQAPGIDNIDSTTK